MPARTEIPDYADDVAAAAWLAATIATEHAGASPDSPLTAAIFNVLFPLVVTDEGKNCESDDASAASDSVR